MQLRPIDIDIDVNRYIEQRRTSFGQTPNDILRQLFGLHTDPNFGTGKSRSGDEPQPVTGDWNWKGVPLPAGTELRMTYNGPTHKGIWRCAANRRSDLHGSVRPRARIVVCARRCPGSVL